MQQHLNDYQHTYTQMWPLPLFATYAKTKIYDYNVSVNSIQIKCSRKKVGCVNKYGTSKDNMFNCFEPDQYSIEK